MKYVLLLVLLAGCNPYLTQQSVAPPGRQAHLNEVRGFWGLKHYRLNISEGVALAVTCERGGPCKNAKVVSRNPAIAEVRAAALSQLKPVGMGGRVQSPPSAFVIVGKSPGTTRLHLTTEDGGRDVWVTVAASP